MTTFNEYMNDEKLVNRWTILKAGLLGGFCGALLGVVICVITFVV